MYIKIGNLAFWSTDITGPIVIPANVDIGGNAFPSGVTIVKG